MKQILSVFLLFSGSLFAQNYNPFPNPQDTLVFANDQDTLRHVKIDSIFTAGSKTTYYLGKEWSAYPDSTINSRCFFSAQNDGWMGAKVVDSANFITFESNAMALMIMKNQAIGQSVLAGTFKRLGDIHQIHVTLDSLTVASGDSLKYFSFRIDTAGQTIAQNLRFALGKNSGILAWPDFLDSKFFDRLEYGHLQGGSYQPESFMRINQPALLTVGDIYDWQVGDEFHYQSQSSSGGSRTNYNQSIFRILSRKIIADSLVYHLLYQSSQNFGVEDTTVQSYHYKNRFPLSFEGVQSTALHNQLFIIWYEQAMHVNHILNGRNGISLYDTELRKWSIPGTCYRHLGLGIIVEEHVFVKGIGEFKSELMDYISPTQYYLRKLVYYKKGNEQWGVPVTINVGIQEKAKEKSIEVFPNPANAKIYFSKALPTHANLLNSNGQLLRKIEAGRSYFDISDLSPGLYILIVGENHVKFTKQ